MNTYAAKRDINHRTSGDVFARSAGFDFPWLHHVMSRVMGYTTRRFIGLRTAGADSSITIRIVR
jgi:hypothetical protein